MSLPPVEIPLGAIRFNSDSQKLEYWMGSAWMQIQTFSPNFGMPSGGSNVGTRGLFMGGLKNQQPSPSTTNEIDYINIASQGDSQDFGDLTTNMYSLAMGQMASTTRGFNGGGSPNPGLDTINSVLFSSTGSAVDFGNMDVRRYTHSMHSNATRGLFMGGYVHPSYNNSIGYITMATEGDAVDFGDMTASTGYGCGGGNSTRAFHFGGANNESKIQKLQIGTLGNAEEFGDLSQGITAAPGSVTNSTRTIHCCGQLAPSPNAITRSCYLYLSVSGGTTTFFGELTASRSYGSMGVSSEVRGVLAGGYTPTQLNTIDYISIITGGNGIDFGDLQSVKRGGSGASNGHGGLG